MRRYFLLSVERQIIALERTNVKYLVKKLLFLAINASEIHKDKH